MTARTLTIRGASYPLVLPNIRDPRLHVAAVIITIHVLGQIGLGFRVTIPQMRTYARRTTRDIPVIRLAAR